MRVLVTGANGFVGRHLTHECRESGHIPVHFDLDQTPAPANEASYVGDLAEPTSLDKVIQETQPDACVHLGGIAFVPMGWTDCQLVMSVNLNGTIHVLEAFRKQKPDARILVISSSEVYGRSPSEAPLTESAPMAPANPYAVSKMGADLITLLYATRYDMHTMTARPDNHIGPGQSERFVASSFARQLMDIASGASESLMKVGNLESERDFTDVRDVARAYRLLLEQGKAGQAYNVASGTAVKIQVILDNLCRAAGITPRIEVDRERYRPADTLPILDVMRVKKATGWQPEFSLEQTLNDIYAHVSNNATGP